MIPKTRGAVDVWASGPVADASVLHLVTPCCLGYQATHLIIGAARFASLNDSLADHAPIEPHEGLHRSRARFCGAE